MSARNLDRVRPFPAPCRVEKAHIALARRLGARLDAAALSEAARALAQALGDPVSLRVVGLDAFGKAHLPPDDIAPPVVALGHPVLGSAWLVVGAALAADCVGRVFGTGEAPAARRLTPAERGAVGYLALRMVEAAPGWRVEGVTQSIWHPPDQAAWVDLDVTIGRDLLHRHWARLVVDGATLLRLPLPPARWERALRLAVIFVDAAVVVGSARLFTAELENLSRGDVVVLEPSPSGGELRVGGGGFPLDVQPQGSRVTGPFESRGERMDERKSDLVQSIPVELVAEIGRLRLTGRELLELEPGAVLALGRPTSGPIDLTCAGRVVARGELVDVDGETGVRLTELLM